MINSDDTKNTESVSDKPSIVRISKDLLLSYKNHPACQERPAFENEDFLVQRGILLPNTQFPESNTSHSRKKPK